MTQPVKAVNDLQVRDQIEKENVSQQPRKQPAPLPPPGQKVDIKVSATADEACIDIACTVCGMPCMV